MKVKIPFLPSFKDVMLNGTKTMTSRTRRMAYVGDTFEAFGETFEIEQVAQVRLRVVAGANWKEEGCKSEEDFIEVWKQIHPRRKYHPFDKVWVHVFRKVKQE